MEQPRILYEDDEMLIIDKPSGFLIHPNKYDQGSPTCTNYLGGLLKQRVFVVHRLDRAVSGVMVFAKSSAAARSLADQFRYRSVDKTYLALVRGAVTQQLEIDEALESKAKLGGRRGGNPDADTHAGSDTDDTKVPAETSVRPLSTTDVDIAVGPYSRSWYSLVEVHLHTGRFHQARKHLRRATHPIIGDRKHGDNKHNRVFQERYETRALFLRASELRFENPSRSSRVFARVAIPEDWEPILEDLGLAVPEQLRREAEVVHG